jgi:hypothetical protein
MLHDSASISLSTLLRWTAVLDNAIAIVPAQFADVQNDQNDAVCIDVRLLLQGQLIDSPVANIARIWWSVRHDACFFPTLLHLASAFSCHISIDSMTFKMVPVFQLRLLQYVSPGTYE